MAHKDGLKTSIYLIYIVVIMIYLQQETIIQRLHRDHLSVTLMWPRSFIHQPLVTPASMWVASLGNQGKYGHWDNSVLHVDGLVQDCSNSIANALELLQSCAKPSM